MPTALRLLAALGAAAAAAMTADLAMANGAQAQSLSSQSLPPPPYAAAQPQAYASQGYAPQTYPGMAPSAAPQAYDRYGAGAHAAPRPITYGQPVYGQGPYGAATAPSGPHLSWGGKVETAAPVAPPPPAQPAYQARMLYPSMAVAAPPRAAPVQAAPARAMAASSGWAFVPPVGGSAPPASIYDPPPPAPAASQPPAAPAGDMPPPPRAAQAAVEGAQAGPKRYSVNRDYGMEPDPIPLPPQFFGATADLTQPATGEPVRRTTTVNGKTQNALQPEGGQ